MLVLCSRPKFHIQLLLLCVPAFIIIYIVWQTFRVYDTPSAYNAYVFYADSDNYACSVLVNAHILQHLMGTRYRILAIISGGVSRTMQDALAAKNVNMIHEKPLPLHANSVSYYKGCLLKLAAFKLHEYDSSIRRLLALDADQLILQNLDKIFDTQMTDFMAPTAYWIGNDTITSTCMLTQPGKPMWDRVEAAATSIESDKYDLDLINDLFAERGDRLSERYVTLNSRWEDWNISLRMGSRSNGNATDEQLRALYDQATIIHFTAAGKPWMHDTQALRDQKPDAHPLIGCISAASLKDQNKEPGKMATILSHKVQCRDDSAIMSLPVRQYVSKDAHVMLPWRYPEMEFPVKAQPDSPRRKANPASASNPIGLASACSRICHS